MGPDPKLMVRTRSWFFSRSVLGFILQGHYAESYRTDLSIVEQLF